MTIMLQRWSIDSVAHTFSSISVIIVENVPATKAPMTNQFLSLWLMDYFLKINSFTVRNIIENCAILRDVAEAGEIANGVTESLLEIGWHVGFMNE